MKVFENVSFIFVIILVSIKKDESVIFGHPVVRQTIKNKSMNIFDVGVTGEFLGVL